MEPTVHQLLDLTGKRALLTGGAGHLGSAMARALAEAGASVIVTSRDVGKARAAAAALPGAGAARHHGLALDHTDPRSIEACFADALGLAGQLDILVNNAHAVLVNDWTSVTFEQFSAQQANAAGYFVLARLLRNHLVERGAPGSVIMIGSMYGQVASYPRVYENLMPANPVAYHMLKGGVIHMTRHLAVYWARDRVRVNCLSPGPFPPAGKVPDELRRRLEQHSPMGRIGEPHELKAAVVFLASDASSYMTGQNMTIDGGWTAW